METLVNKVAQSGIITFNLEDYFPNKDIISLDIKNFLFMGLILKEKEFRQSLKDHDWLQYSNKIVLISCSEDAILPSWSYMLLESYLADVAEDVYYGTKEEFLIMYYKNVIKDLDLTLFDEKRIVIKGCGEKPVPAAAYGMITSRLKSCALSIMFGEPCSTVPIYKKPKNPSNE